MEHLDGNFTPVRSFFITSCFVCLVRMEFIGGGHISFSSNPASLNCSLVDLKNVL